MAGKFLQKFWRKLSIKKKVTTTPGKYHLEDRYDTKSGKKIEPEKVWDEKPTKNVESWYEIDGHKFDCDYYEFIGELEEQLGCQIIDNRDDSCYISILTDEDLYDCGNIMTCGKISVSKLQTKLEELNVLKTKLESYGIKLKEAEIFIGSIEYKFSIGEFVVVLMEDRWVGEYNLQGKVAGYSNLFVNGKPTYVIKLDNGKLLLDICENRLVLVV